MLGRSEHSRILFETKDPLYLTTLTEFLENIKQFICRAAAMTLRTVLLSLQALLSAAEPDDPQDAVVAKQFKENVEMFQSTAKHWTNVYAGGKYATLGHIL